MPFTHGRGRSSLGVRVAIGLFLSLASLSLHSQGGRVGPARLDRNAIVRLARLRAPAVLRAEVRVRLAKASLVGASRFSTRNPSLRVFGGPRFSSNGVSPDLSLSGWIPVPLLIDRARSLSAARAGVETAQLDVEVVRLAAAGIALDLYVLTLHAKNQLQLAKERSELAREFLSIATARDRAGDASRLEVEVAKAESFASAAGELAADAALVSALQNLALALGLQQLDASEIGGALVDQLALPAELRVSVEDLATMASKKHPELRAADGKTRASKEEEALAAVGWLPQVSVGAGYGFEEGGHTGSVGVAVGVPFYDSGQSERAGASALVAVNERESELRRLALSSEVLQAVLVHTRALAASTLLGDEALPHAKTASDLASVGYAAGKTDLGAVLLVRRHNLSIRAEHLARQLDAALAANRVALVAGIIHASDSASDLKPERRNP